MGTPSPCSAAEQDTTPKLAPNPSPSHATHRSRLRLPWLRGGARGKEPRGKIPLPPHEGLTSRREAPAEGRGPGTPNAGRSGGEGSEGGDGDVAALRGRLEKSCLCSPLGASCCPYPRLPPSSVSGEAPGGAFGGLPPPAPREPSSVPLPGAGSSVAKQHGGGGDALQEERGNTLK